MKKFLFLCTLALIYGCTDYNFEAQKLQTTATEADYGNPPPKDYQKITEDFIRDKLKDPDSGKFKNWTAPYRCVYRYIGKPKLGWCTRVEVNAKNGFGAYTGFSLWEIDWTDGKIYDFYHFQNTY
jgi:hypothetical protein